jgi:S-adenosylmethionine-diacylgycerolhomoserine-N-methlytransferase
MNSISLKDEPLIVQNIEKYYSFHAYIYDLTRWTFLFGRKKLLKKIPVLKTDVKRIVEIGCGTGHNLVLLANRFPNAAIIGVDISEDMLSKAAENTSMYPNITVCKELNFSDRESQFDLVLMSYVLTMMNPGWDYWIKEANNLLNHKGYLLVVDFHTSIFNWFRRHMSNHHVRMEAHLLPELSQKYKKFHSEINSAYLFTWEYFLFVGKKKQNK